jgi:peptide chain release factor 3
MAADSAVMLLDNRKGVEEQTRKLFEVCRLRRIPIFTFVNKCDRIGVSPLQLLDDVEAELGIACAPLTWPVTDGSQFLGVFDRLDRAIHLFEKGQDHGAQRAGTRVAGLDDPEVDELLGGAAADRLREEIELLDAVGTPFDLARFHAGEISPTFFGSALTNFGVEPFLRRFLATPRRPPPELHGGAHPPPIRASPPSSSRSRRTWTRSTGTGSPSPGSARGATSPGQSGDQRPVGEAGAAGRGAAVLRAGAGGGGGGVAGRRGGAPRPGEPPDRRHAGLEGFARVRGHPPFSPEHFARVHVPDPLRRKHLDKGLLELSEEGPCRSSSRTGDAGPAPVVGAVGPLQFDVLLHRLEHEYGVAARLDPMPYRDARWVTGPLPEIRRVAVAVDAALVFDRHERPLLLFRSEWVRQATEQREKGIGLSAPSGEIGGAQPVFRAFRADMRYFSRETACTGGRRRHDVVPTTPIVPSDPGISMISITQSGNVHLPARFSAGASSAHASRGSLYRCLAGMGLLLLGLLAGGLPGFGAAAVAAQEGTIQGRIIDGQSGSPIVAAMITMDNAEGRTVVTRTADRNGVFTARLAPGVYSLTLLAVGYGRQELGQVTVTAGQVTRVDFTASSIAVVLEEVVALVTIGVENVREASSAIGIISEEEIRARPVTTPWTTCVRWPRWT